MGLNTHEKNLIFLWICVEIAICNNKRKKGVRNEIKTSIISRTDETFAGAWAGHKRWKHVLVLRSFL